MCAVLFEAMVRRGIILALSVSSTLSRTMTSSGVGKIGSLFVDLVSSAENNERRYSLKKRYITRDLLV